MSAAAPPAYTQDEAAAAGWRVGADALTKTFRFVSFRAAIDFMSDCAPAIDALDHHPDWTNVYDRLQVKLTTHDAGAVTARDFRLARLLDARYAAFTRSVAGS